MVMLKTDFSGCPDRFLRSPAGQSLGFVVDHDDLALNIGRDNAVADGAQRHGETFFFRGDLFSKRFRSVTSRTMAT